LKTGIIRLRSASVEEVLGREWRAEEENNEKRKETRHLTKVGGGVNFVAAAKRIGRRHYYSFGFTSSLHPFTRNPCAGLKQGAPLFVRADNESAR
jgi:hypothetical protein